MLKKIILFKEVKKSNKNLVFARSKAAKGSSKIKILLSLQSRAIILISCCCPPLSSLK